MIDKVMIGNIKDKVGNKGIFFRVIVILRV